ncbi:FitA-like ribbon-helix-helix domain-containing protein [Luteimonas wenzhouensis]|uniref:FitA-like ribbon-helix-helix domain-containing protein n=1 Tax=Luteimonas wenzhouensis TaxID=2599615 RepID=UPI003CCC5B20
MPEGSMSTLTIQHLDDEVMARLRARAAAHTSIDAARTDRCQLFLACARNTSLACAS